MKLEEFENLLVSQLQTVVENIIEDQQSLEISAKSRSGRNPKNQLQVNISQETEYRSRKEFIELLVNKLQESYHRQIDKAQKELELLETKKQKLIEANHRSEEEMINKLRRLKRRD